MIEDFRFPGPPYITASVKSSIAHHQSQIVWRAWGDLNTRHTAPEAVALSGLSYRRKVLNDQFPIPIDQWETIIGHRSLVIRILALPSRLVGVIPQYRHNNWSGREDLNLRPPAPKAGALPGCATPRSLPVPRPDQRSDCGCCGTPCPKAGALPGLCRTQRRPTAKPPQKRIRSSWDQPRPAGISRRISRAPAMAWARWLRRFLTSGDTSAKVFPRDGTSKMES